MLNNQPQAGKREVHRLDFFRPDQLVFLVTHETTINEQLPEVSLREWVAMLNDQLSKDEKFSTKPARDFVGELCEQLNDEHLPEKQLNEWTENLKGQLKEQGWNLVDPQPRSYSFPPVNTSELEEVPLEYQQELFPSAFSIIVCNVQEINPGKANANSNDPRAVDEGKNDPAKVNQKRVVTKQHLLNLISILDQQIRERLTWAGLTVQAITPNWIASSGKSDSGGTGGPGSEPVPFRGTKIAKNIRYYFKDLITKLKGEDEESQGTNLYGEGEGVDVVILDTAPSADDLVLAYKELVLRKPEGEEHPLVKSLLETKGLLNLYPATFEELQRMGNTSLNRHGYKMNDHGLFIAGIINSIVPKATIHLVQVLNQFGVGDIETISRGFSKAYAISRRKKQHLVVNCSLCLDLPDLLEIFAYRESDAEAIEPEEKEFEKELRHQMKQETDQLKKQTDGQSKRLQDELRWVLHLRVMCERLGKVGKQVVAAAGNDSKKKPGEQRNAQGARYPAAFSKVVGVGALPKDAIPGTNNKYEASSFSNLADKPAQTGIMALGGEPGAGKGVLGLYLGEFPDVSNKADQTTETDTDDKQTIQPEADQPFDENGWSQVASNNKLGWAWWAGTSFATPVLTATIASVLSAPAPSRTTQNALGRLYTAKVILNALTKETEDGIPSSVKQVINPNL